MPSIRPVDFDGAFELDASARQTLFELLRSQGFYTQVCQHTGCGAVEFTELLFQPVPYSFNTPHGMAKQYEPYYQSEDYLIINVPANFMFKAKISHPNRLCAIYRKAATRPEIPAG